MSARLNYPAILLLLVCSLQAKAAPLQLNITETPLIETDGTPAVFSPDFRHAAIIRMQGTNTAVCIDDETPRVYESAGYLKFSPDSKTVAYVADRHGEQMVVVNGHEGRLFDGIYWKEASGSSPLTFSPDSRHLAWVIVKANEKANLQKVVLDDKEGEQSYQVIVEDTLLFSPDSKHLAYVGISNYLSVVNLDSRELTVADEASSLTFSPDGNRFAYVVRRGTNWHVVVDGVESPAWEGINRDRRFGNESDLGDLGPLPPLVFSQDSQHFAYEAIRNREPIIVLDGKILAHGQVQNLILSPNGRRFAYVQADARVPTNILTRVIVDGVVGEALPGKVTFLAFTPNSDRIVCLRHDEPDGGEDDEMTAILSINRDVNRKFQAILPASLSFSPDGRRMAYMAATIKKRNRVISWVEEKFHLVSKDTDLDEPVVRVYAVMDGSPQAAGGENVEEVYFDRDLRHWACLERGETNQFVIVDGNRLGPYKTIEPTDGPVKIETAIGHRDSLEPTGNNPHLARISFSPDGQHFAFEASKEKEGAVLVVDGVEKVVNGFWDDQAALAFDTPTHLHGLLWRTTGQDRQRLFRLEVELPQPK